MSEVEYYRKHVAVQTYIRQTTEWFEHEDTCDVCDFWAICCQQSSTNPCLQQQNHDSALSYEEVDQLTSSAAIWCLKSLGVRPGMTVALMMENHIEFVCIWLSLAKAGCTISLINTHLRDLHLLAAISTSSAQILVVSEQLRPFVSQATECHASEFAVSSLKSFKFRSTSQLWLNYDSTADAEPISRPLQFPGTVICADGACVSINFLSVDQYQHVDGLQSGPILQSLLSQPIRWPSISSLLSQKCADSGYFLIASTVLRCIRRQRCPWFQSPIDCETLLDLLSKQRCPDVDLSMITQSLVVESRRTSSSIPSTVQQFLLSLPNFYIFTSGTSGPSKAALFSHRRVIGAGITWRCAMKLTKCNALANSHEIPLLSDHWTLRTSTSLLDQERMYIPLPLFHGNGGVVALAAAWHAGALCVIRPKFSASEFWSDISRYQCTSLVYIGELWRYLSARPESEFSKHFDASNHQRRPTLWSIAGNGLRIDLWSLIHPLHFFHIDPP